MSLRRIYILLLSLFVVIMGFIRGVHLFDTWSLQDTHVKKTYSSYTSTDVDIYTYVVDGEPMRYMELGNRAGPLLVFIHGAPGSITSWTQMIEFTHLSETYRIFILDRPGYGKSYNGYAVTSLEKQARYIQPLVEKNTHTTKPILIGHSFGGPVVTQLLIDYPESTGGGIVIAGAVDPAHEIIWKISYVMELPIIRSLIPYPLKVTNKEKFSHRTELTTMQPLLKKITQPLTIMHGHKDRIVPVENAFYLETHATNAQLDMRVKQEWNHFLPFTHMSDIVHAIEDMQVILSD